MRGCGGGEWEGVREGGWEGGIVPTLTFNGKIRWFKCCDVKNAFLVFAMCQLEIFIFDYAPFEPKQYNQLKACFFNRCGPCWRLLKNKISRS